MDQLGRTSMRQINGGGLVTQSDDKELTFNPNINTNSSKAKVPLLNLKLVRKSELSPELIDSRATIKIKGDNKFEFKFPDQNTLAKSFNKNGGLDLLSE